MSTADHRTFERKRPWGVGGSQPRALPISLDAFQDKENEGSPGFGQAKFLKEAGLRRKQHGRSLAHREKDRAPPGDRLAPLDALGRQRLLPSTAGDRPPSALPSSRDVSFEMTVEPENSFRSMTPFKSRTVPSPRPGKTGSILSNGRRPAHPTSGKRVRIAEEVTEVSPCATVSKRPLRRPEALDIVWEADAARSHKPVSPPTSIRPATAEMVPTVSTAPAGQASAAAAAALSTVRLSAIALIDRLLESSSPSSDRPPAVPPTDAVPACDALVSCATDGVLTPESVSLAAIRDLRPSVGGMVPAAPSAVSPATFGSPSYGREEPLPVRWPVSSAFLSSSSSSPPPPLPSSSSSSSSPCDPFQFTEIATTSAVEESADVAYDSDEIDVRRFLPKPHRATPVVIPKLSKAAAHTQKDRAPKDSARRRGHSR